MATCIGSSIRVPSWASAAAAAAVVQAAGFRRGRCTTATSLRPAEGNWSSTATPDLCISFHMTLAAVAAVVVVAAAAAAAAVEVVVAATAAVVVIMEAEAVVGVVEAAGLCMRGGESHR